MQNKRYLIKKDLLDAIKNWEILYSIISIPILTIFIIILLIKRETDSNLIFPPHHIHDFSDINALYVVLGLDKFHPQVAFSLLQFNTVYFYAIVLIGLVLPLILSSTSITAEREQGTLESLLILPFSDINFLIAKIMSSTIPTFFLTIICYILINTLAYLYLGFCALNYLLSLKWWILHLIIVPLYATIMATSGICISIKVKTSRAALMLNFIVAIPFIPLLISLMYGNLIFNLRFAFISIIIGFIMGIIIFVLALHLFNREKLILNN